MWTGVVKSELTFPHCICKQRFAIVTFVSGHITMICLHFLIHLNSNKDVNILKVFSPGEEEIYWYVTGEGGSDTVYF